MINESTNKTNEKHIDVNIDKVDIEILFTLFTNNKDSILKSFRIKDIMKETDHLKIVYYTYVNRIKKLLELNFINEGVKDKKARTYFITQLGKEYVNENVLSQVDIFEEDESEE